MHSETDEMMLTAYAVGELEGAQRMEVEERLAASGEDRRFVEEVRAAAKLVSSELAREPVSGLEAIHYAAIELRLREPSAPFAAGRGDVNARMGLFFSLAASIVVIGGTIGVILFSISRHRDVSVNRPQTQPSGTPILIPLESTGSDSNESAFGAPMIPPSSDPFVAVADHPVSSFGMDPDTGAYEEVRQAIFANHLPTRDSLKIEGLINAFDYDDPAPPPGATFGASIEVGQCPWEPQHRLARIAITTRPGAGAVAEEVRTEVEFLPGAVKSYRLIGYDLQTRGESARGESVAGGRAVTALYEVVAAKKLVNPIELLKLRVRYRTSAAAAEQVVQFIGRDVGLPPAAESADFRFAAAVAEFGMVLRRMPQLGTATIDHTIALAESGRGEDPSGERREFVELARRAKQLMG